MKKNLLFVFLLTLFLINPSMAKVTLEEATDAEYMINSGYSQALVEDIFVQKNRMVGNPIEPLYEKSDRALVKTWKKFYSYLDPAQDTYDKLHHDIKLSPHPSDL